MKPVLGVVSPMSMEADLLPVGKDVLIIPSGIGTENAGAAAWRLVDHGVTALAVTGVAGGLDPVLHVGDLVIPEIILESPTGPAEGERRPVKQVLKGSITDAISSLLLPHGINVHRGILLTTPDPILTPREKSALFTRYGAQAVDMESAAVFRVAHEKNLPFFVIRSICDTATTEIPVNFFQAVDGAGAIRWPLLLTRLVRNPLLVLRLVRLSRDFSRARRVLKTAWRLMLKENLLDRIN
jgi:adenosylhomocysteine nucleosidase